MCLKQKWLDKILQSMWHRHYNITPYSPWSLHPWWSISDIYRYGKDDGKKHFHSTAYHGWAISKGERGTSAGRKKKKNYQSIFQENESLRFPSDFQSPPPILNHLSNAGALNIYTCMYFYAYVYRTFEEGILQKSAVKRHRMIWRRTMSG